MNHINLVLFVIFGIIVSYWGEIMFPSCWVFLLFQDSRNWYCCFVACGVLPSPAPYTPFYFHYVNRKRKLKQKRSFFRIFFHDSPPSQKTAICVHNVLWNNEWEKLCSTAKRFHVCVCNLLEVDGADVRRTLKAYTSTTRGETRLSTGSDMKRFPGGAATVRQVFHGHVSMCLTCSH